MVNKLDVLVVYSGKSAVSASDLSSPTLYPFPGFSGKSNYNQSYSYFLNTCQALGLKAAFSTSSDIMGAGLCKSYWEHDGVSWGKNSGLCYSQNIFDKLSPSSIHKIDQRALLFSSPSIVPFNSLEISTIFTDKLKSYQKLSSFAIPTVKVGASVALALSSLTSLVASHPHRSDFGSALVLKDRFGAGGQDIHLIKSNFISKIKRLIKASPKRSYILQPYLDFDLGYSYGEKKVRADLRLIYQNTKLIQTYIRIAQDQSFLCNRHQGGNLIYVKKTQIPALVLKMGEEINNKLKVKRALYALDFVVSNTGNCYFLEGNTGPGIDWDSSLTIDEHMNKKLIRGIVLELAKRVRANS